MLNFSEERENLMLTCHKRGEKNMLQCPEKRKNLIGKKGDAKRKNMFMEHWKADAKILQIGKILNL